MYEFFIGWQNFNLESLLLIVYRTMQSVIVYFRFQLSCTNAPSFLPFALLLAIWLRGQIRVTSLIRFHKLSIPTHYAAMSMELRYKSRVLQ